jgi:hypothetical protein
VDINADKPSSTLMLAANAGCNFLMVGPPRSDVS